jgi:L-seryl-tRNA(Ser) seleniumtransferase
LLAYVKRDFDAIPAVRMMNLSRQAIGVRADVVAGRVRSANLEVELIDGESVIGGGAAPSSVLPTRLLAITCNGLSANELASNLRVLNPPIIARVEDGRVLLDLRTVFPLQDDVLIAALERLAK